MNAKLVGRRVVTTRDEPGQLDRLLAETGVEVLHVPLIEVVDADDGGAALDAALEELAALPSDSTEVWLAVTSRHGARRVGAAAATNPGWRLAAVGTTTAREFAALAGRDVDVVPERQTAADLVAAMPEPTEGAVALVAQADRADDTLLEGLVARGFAARSVVAYRTLLRTLTESERADALAADVVAFASASAAEAWASAIGTDTPPCVVAIGPTTADAARAAGLQVTHVAADHSVVGLVFEIARAIGAQT